MASREYGKDSKEFQMFQEYWKLVKQFAVPEDKDEYWKSLHDACRDFGNKYGTFATQIAIAYMAECDRKAKGAS